MLRTTCVFLSLVAIAFIGACGGSSSSDTGTCDAATQDVTGGWSIQETASSSDPSCSGFDSYGLTATQDGSGNVMVTDTNGRNYSGRMCGNQLRANVPFSYAEDGGTTTITSLTITVNGTSLSFTSSWMWTDGGSTCSGTSTGTGTR